MNELLSMGTLHRASVCYGVSRIDMVYCCHYPLILCLCCSFGWRKEGTYHSTPLVSHVFFVLSFIFIIVKEDRMATVEKQGYFTGWTPKTGGIIAPDERLPWG